MDESQLRILRREHGECLVCGKRGLDVHEVIPRSALPGKDNAEILFSDRNRCYLCRLCHVAVHTVWGRCMLFGILKLRYGYKYDDNPFRSYFEVRYL